MFLTPDQRRRKEAIKKEQAGKRKAIDAANKLLSDRAQRDAWAHSASCAAVSPGMLFFLLFSSSAQHNGYTFGEPPDRWTPTRFCKGLLKGRARFFFFLLPIIELFVTRPLPIPTITA